MITIAECKEKIAAGALLVDVRTPAEFKNGALDGALNIPLQEVAGRLSEFGGDMDREIILYCQVGQRSGAVQEWLESRGFRRVYNAPGYADWLRAR